MAGYIGSKASVVSSGAERKKTFTITGATTSLTGLNYTVGKVHVFQNGVRLVDGTDYTATNGTTITLTVAAQSGDNVVVISQASFQVADALLTSGGTMTGDLTVQGAFTSKGIDDNADAVALTIDSNENVLVGKTSQSVDTVGGEILPSGIGQFTVDGNFAGRFTRQTSDGDIVVFRKGTGTVGSIDTSGGNLIVQGSTSAGKTGIKFGGSQWIPQDNGNSDGGVDLGISSARFKDAYLSGGIYLGGTVAANKLDDYEEGGGIPSVGATVSGTISYPSTATSKYVKIGSLVTFNFEFQVTATGTGAIRVNLPFTPNAYAAGSLRVYNVSFSGTSPFLEVVPNDARAIFFSNTNNSPTSSIMSTGFYYGAITYTTDS